MLSAKDKKMTKIAIMGASGRMGRMLIDATLNHPNATLTHAFVRQSSSLIGVDAGELVGLKRCGVSLSSLDNCDMPNFDVLIDFSLPEALTDTLAFCQKHHKKLVMGVTGLSDSQVSALTQFASSSATVYAGNYSTGVNLSLDLLATTAKVLGLQADVEIIESHHKHKLDAPSGTALMMADAIIQARQAISHDSNFSQHLVYGRSGATKRQLGEIGIHAIRGGEIVGEHTVQFITNHEIIEITHKAQSRTSFAHGAVKASVWLNSQPAGLYDMQDVLGLK